eukprot:TRINITY_DN2207_c0_g1_i1.p1 TRINITY_DN2207_c0_g1~~TRINITY_DN2207_c0_g1_i1.p1  ORF type:complete len:210 (+),score=45.38 TRINITY_DN2207_c0_g1_i1:478-1107(+)
MPGETDPCGFTCPQQPFPSFFPLPSPSPSPFFVTVASFFVRCLFPQATSYSTFHAVTNPHECEVGGRIFIGSSGQMVDNIERLARLSPMSATEGSTPDTTTTAAATNTLVSRLAVLEHSLHWRHLAPTAPDTLGCYPFADDDPFILDQSPHVYFAGNQPEFATRTITGACGQRVALVLVPSFSLTGTAVLVNLSTLQVFPFVFKSTGPV